MIGNDYGVAVKEEDLDKNPHMDFRLDFMDKLKLLFGGYLAVHIMKYDKKVEFGFQVR